MSDDPIFAPLSFRNLEVQNRVLRSSIAGRFDGWDGSGQQARIIEILVAEADHVPPRDLVLLG